MAAIHKAEYNKKNHHDDNDNRGVDHDELSEREPSFRADHNVWRIADKRRGTSDVRHHDFDEEERHRIDVQRFA